MSKQSNPANTIFVGNLPTSITAELLHSTFSIFGLINDIQIPKDHQKHTNRNFAFISFNSSDSALNAIDNVHLNIISNIDQNLVLKVNLARSSKILSSSDQNGNPFINRRAIWDDENWIKEHALNEKPDELITPQIPQEP